MAKKIIIVDDSKALRQQLGSALTAAGFEAIEAVDGVDGLEKIRDHLDASLVICDVIMPRMSGLELLEAVRADGRFAALPILILTTEGERGLVRQAKRAGAAGWVVKP